MKVLLLQGFNFNPLNSRKNTLNLRLNTLQADTVSFSAKKKDLNAPLFELPKEAFPSADLRNYLIAEVQNPDNTLDIPSLHQKYYSGLRDCTTLDEAKELYPEFQDVVDLSDLDTSKLRSDSIFLKINDGIAEGIDLNNVSIEVLKMYYLDLMTNKEISAVFDLGGNGLVNLMKKLNISMDNRYIKLLNSFKHSKAADRLWSDETHRDNVSKKNSAHAIIRWQDPKYQQERSRSSKASWTPEKRQQQSEIMIQRNVEFKTNPKYESVVEKRVQKVKETWTPEKRQEQSQKTKAYNAAHPEKRSRMEIVYRANSEAHKRHPEIREIYSKLAKESGPALWGAFDKLRKKKSLSDEQLKTLHSYYRACRDACPDVYQIIAQTQTDILKEWGFYEEVKEEIELFEQGLDEQNLEDN